MKIDKSLQEVWRWKEKSYKKTESLSLKKVVKKIKEDAQEICKKYNLQLKTLTLSKK